MDFSLRLESQQPRAKVRVDLCQLKRKSVASAVSMNVMVSSCLIQLVFLCSHRSNLDPWDQYSDSQIWDALEKTHIKEMVSDKNGLRACVLLKHFSSPLSVIGFRSASCLIHCMRRWRRTERISLWGNDSFSVWPEPCCATARCWILKKAADFHVGAEHHLIWWYSLRQKALLF